MAPTSPLPDNLVGGIFSSGQNTGTSGLNASSASSGYTGASGGNNLTIGVAPTGALSTSESAYFAFTLTATNNTAVNASGLTLGSRSTGSGPQLLSLYSSNDHFSSNWTALGSVTASANSMWTLFTFASFNVSSTTNGSLAFRLYGSDGTGSTGAGNWRIDDVSLTATSFAPLPEPASIGGIAGALALACVLHRRRPRP